MCECQTWLVICEIHRKLQSFVNILAKYYQNLVAQGYIQWKLWEITDQININMEIRSANLVGLDIRSVRMIVSLARQFCNGIHKVQEGREGQENSGRRTTLNECGTRIGSHLRFIARDLEGWRKFVDNLCFWWNYGLYYYCYVIHAIEKASLNK
jgi:hypothetical protein